MKKKILALVLAAVLVVALAACGGDTKDPADGNNSGTNNPSNPNPAPAPTPTPTPTPDPTPAAPTGAARFAGEYELYCEAKDMYCDEFIIDADGTVHGVVEGSGLTTFEGTVDADGNISCEVTRLGGTMVGTIDDSRHISVDFSVRGSDSHFEGDPL